MGRQNHEEIVYREKPILVGVCDGGHNVNPFKDPNIFLLYHFTIEKEVVQAMVNQLIELDENLQRDFRCIFQNQGKYKGVFDKKGFPKKI
jgi:hypothetical protein